MRGRARSICMTALVVLVQVQSVHANAILPFTDLFEKLDGVGVWGAVSLTKKSAPRDRYGSYGMEIFLGPYGTKSDRASILERLKDARDSVAVESLRPHMTLTVPKDTLDAVIRRRNEDITKFEAQKFEGDGEEAKTQVLIGVGYEYVEGFTGTIDSLEVRVPARGFYLGAYLERLTKCPVSFYVGGIIGLFETSNATAYGPNGYVSTIDRSTVAGEGLLGINVSVAGFANIFFEGGYRYMAFEGLKFDATASGIRAPTQVPRRLDFSGPRFALGLQISKK